MERLKGFLQRRFDVTLTVTVMVALSIWAPGRSLNEIALTGGLMYLLNKVCLSVMERRRHLTYQEAFWFWRRAAWAVYLMGLPAIVAYFVSHDNWIFAAIEIGGAPAMLYGLVVAIRRREPPSWLDALALLAMFAGVGLSVWQLQGLTQPLTQLLELGGGIGFLLGTLLLAQDNRQGYKFFLLMGVSTGLLFFVQEAYLLAGMQVLSICFVLDGMQQKKRFLSVPQVRDLEGLVDGMMFGGVSWHTADNPWPRTARLWNGYLVTFRSVGSRIAGGSSQPVDFVEKRYEPQLAKKLLPVARKLAEEGAPALIQLLSPDPFLARAGVLNTYLWTRYAVARKSPELPR